MDYQDETLAMIGSRIVELRKLKGIKQVDLAITAGIDNSSLRRIEEGKANPTVKSLAKIAKALDVPIIELFTRINEYSDTNTGLKTVQEHFQETLEIDRSIEFLKRNGFLIFKSV